MDLLRVCACECVYECDCVSVCVCVYACREESAEFGAVPQFPSSAGRQGGLREMDRWYGEKDAECEERRKWAPPERHGSHVTQCHILFRVLNENLISITGTLFTGYSEIENWQIFD